MHLPQSLIEQLNILSESLDGSGDDLAAILAVLADDLTAAIPSFLGLSMTLRVGRDQVAITAIAPGPARTSILLPLPLITKAPDGSRLIFYATTPGAFIDLAADTRATFHLDGQVVLDGNLPPPPVGDDQDSRGMSLEERSTLHQAIGVLIDRGHSPEDAPGELQQRAAASDITVGEAARQVLSQVERGGQ